MPAPPAGARVAIISGSFGAGHDAAAREIGIRLGEHGVACDLLDIVDLYPPGLGGLLRRVYFLQLRTVPASWRWLLGRLEGEGSRLNTAARLVSQVGGRRTRARAATGYLAVVSTHPLASQMLGQLRRRDRLRTPVMTYLTDASVHGLWVHERVDLHLAIHAVAAKAALDHGARLVEVVQPAVRHGFDHPADRGLDHATDGGFDHPTETRRAQARAQHGLPATGALVLITGGSEGVVELVEAASDIREHGGGVPVVLCGRNDSLRRRLEDEPGVLALGWVQDMTSLYAAVDVVVQNAGGSTSLEALAARRPVLSYRCIPGHGETNAAALADAGLAPWARDREDLDRLLAAALAGPVLDPHGEGDPVDGLSEQPCVGAVILRATVGVP